MSPKPQPPPLTQRPTPGPYALDPKPEPSDLNLEPDPTPYSLAYALPLSFEPCTSNLTPYAFRPKPKSRIPSPPSPALKARARGPQLDPERRRKPDGRTDARARSEARRHF